MNVFRSYLILYIKCPVEQSKFNGSYCSINPEHQDIPGVVLLSQTKTGQ